MGAPKGQPPWRGNKKRGSSRIRLVVLMMINMLAALNLGAMFHQRGWRPALVALYVLALLVASLVIRVTPGITRLGIALYSLLAVVIVAMSVYPPSRTATNCWDFSEFGPLLILLTATLISVGPGWGKRHHA